MKTVAIIGNGSFPRQAYPRYVIMNADVIICCDGALAKYLKHSEQIFGKERRPDLVIGDMDSLTPSLRKKYSDICVHVPEQETNDQTKAVKYAIENIADVSEIHILGATGAREDHTIGNLALLMEYTRMWDLESKEINIDIISDYGTFFAITDTTELHLGKDRRISIFCPDNSLNIKSQGLEWPLDNVVFDNWWKATLNKTNDDIVKLQFSHKSMALIAID